MKKVLLILCILVFSLTCLCSCAGANPTVMRDISTMKLVAEMGVGINLGNTFDCSGDWISKNVESVETAWGSPVITKEMIECCAEAGFGVMRLPVTWGTLADENYNVDKDFMKRIKEVVDWILDSGMYCILNTHHDGWPEKFTEDYEGAMKKYENLWKQIAKEFKNYDDKLIFESMNEVGFDDIWNSYAGNEGKDEAFRMFNGINQTFVDVVRSSGGNNSQRHLLIAAYWTSIERACDDLFILPDDPAGRFAVSVHYYGPSTLTLISEDVSWGKAKTTWGSEADYAELTMWMNMIEEELIDNGIPVFIGEYGCFGNNKTRETRTQYMYDVASYAYLRGICPILWDTPGGELNRDLARFMDEEFIEKLTGIP
ncbi:MAG: glycoside hydrolase family 5 protein, partial [Oscillospiraceae bacterium]|nr:glycoside hydrolase family 5 protein [Oscillospiraceae bacterium]